MFLIGVHNRVERGHAFATQGQHRDLVVEAERTHIHVRRPENPHRVIDRDALGMQNVRGRVPVDLHAGVQQRVVVGLLRVVGDLVVAFAAQIQFDVNPGLRRGRQRIQQRIIGNQVRRRDAHLPSRVIDERVEHPQVVLLRVTRARRDHLSERIARAVVLGELELIEHLLTGFEVPVGCENEVQVVDHGAFDAGHHVDPFAPQLVSGTAQVARFDEVDRTGHADAAVDHEDLAVVA